MSPALAGRLFTSGATWEPRSKRLLISWLQSPSAMILEPPKIKSDTVSTVSPSISHEVMGNLVSGVSLLQSQNTVAGSGNVACEPYLRRVTWKRN